MSYIKIMLFTLLLTLSQLHAIASFAALQKHSTKISGATTLGLATLLLIQAQKTHTNKTISFKEHLKQMMYDMIENPKKNPTFTRLARALIVSGGILTTLLLSALNTTLSKKTKRITILKGENIHSKTHIINNTTYTQVNNRCYINGIEVTAEEFEIKAKPTITNMDKDFDTKFKNFDEKMKKFKKRMKQTFSKP